MDIKTILHSQREYFLSGSTRPISFRLARLKDLKQTIIRREQEIIQALKKDLNKATFEAYATEIGLTLEELKYTIRHLPAWAKPHKVKTGMANFPAKSYIIPEPYGIALIMSPWNYPFNLALTPLIGAIAAGNCSIIKPSAYAPHTSSVVAQIIGDCFAEKFVAVVEGGRQTNQDLLSEKFDYIFFTGSVAVGKTVMRAAAEHLTPVTLELGGKSPCIVDRDVNIDLAARRITWGKFLNAGQTCVAPDFLLVHKSIKDELLYRIKKYITIFYGRNPCSNTDYPKIINQRHFNRLLNLLKRGDIVTGGQYSKDKLVIEPTVIEHITWEDPVMQEEVFGPILPVLEYENLAEVIAELSRQPSPLALYFFSTNRKNQQRVVENLSYGGGCINDTVMHLATPYLPFGGVGNSGMGAYHGKTSFDTFSHTKSILNKSYLLDIKLRYPPYNKNKLTILKHI
ncbi:Aldehyde dehydrogenase [Sporotomaculum syntrophicum]|uniref:Aldehyde dehydrogenase n=1 Tax=Sporotomaculum syntrophicum TaxID=182264 RepID=A0A9D3AX79_9FIRM|nr:aldehyde dehydrogenase [Sporotomaculum syntrophicum]KAF1084732.1 Aldehyde dehydrogenase [Sporotomaculum syntrophicum]